MNVKGSEKTLLWPNVSVFFLSKTTKTIVQIAGVHIKIILLKTKRNLLYIRHKSVPYCKHSPSWL
jgi:hypothetical protein